jgi:ribosomal protein S16
MLGSFEKGAKTSPSNLKKDRFDYWVSQGARPTPTVSAIFKK